MGYIFKEHLNMRTNATTMTLQTPCYDLGYRELSKMKRLQKIKQKLLEKTRLPTFRGGPGLNFRAERDEDDLIYIRVNRK
jgi:hypothetical protein